jgi:GTP cyclohydrolase IIa
MLQARIYHDVQRLFSERDSIVFFNRFDEYFAITNGLGVDDHLHIQHELTKLYDNMLMSMTIGAGKTAFEANLNAYRTRKEGRMLDGNSRIFGSVQPQADVAQIMHIDIDSSAKVGNWLSPYELTALVMKIYSRLAEEFLKHDSLAFFLGGDNVMVISNGMAKEQADVVLKKVTAGNDIKLNCGIGIGKTGRRAAEAATKALDTIRDLREEGKIQTIYEIQCP